MKQSNDDRSWSFLIASPELDAPVFDESVVLILEDADEGSFGVIVNKPVGKMLSETDKQFAKYKELSQIEVFDGGPLAKDRLSIAVWHDDNSATGIFSFGVTPEKAETILLEKPDAQAIAFIGYTGWSNGQLEGEIEEGSWITAAADLSLLSNIDPEDLWEELLVRDNPIFERFPDPPEKPESNN